MAKKRKKKKGKMDAGKLYPVLDSTIMPRLENSSIAQFLKCLSEKNYSAANKYLQATIDDKVRMRIAHLGQKYVA